MDCRSSVEVESDEEDTFQDSSEVLSEGGEEITDPKTVSLGKLSTPPRAFNNVSLTLDKSVMHDDDVCLNDDNKTMKPEVPFPSSVITPQGASTHAPQGKRSESESRRRNFTSGTRSGVIVQSSRGGKRGFEGNCWNKRHVSYQP